MENKAILVVEEDADLLDLYKHFFHIAGWTVIEAISFADALTKIPTIPLPSLLVALLDCDLGSEKREAHALSLLLREYNQHILQVGISYRAERHLGFDYYTSKKPQDIVQILNSRFNE